MRLGRAARGALEAKSVHVASAQGADAEEAVARLRERLPIDDYSAILVFFSPDYPPHHIAAAMAKRFPGQPVFGCTTAGELSPEGIGDGGIVALGFRAGDFNIVARPIPDLDSFTFESVRDCDTPVPSEASVNQVSGPGVTMPFSGSEVRRMSATCTDRMFFNSPLAVGVPADSALSEYVVLVPGLTQVSTLVLVAGTDGTP